MKLHFSPSSPFVRMVRVTAHETGLSDQIELVPTGVISPVEVHGAVAGDNPIGKIPVLITDHGTAVYDSRVICQYLAHHAGNGDLYPHEPVRFFHVLTMEALCQGMAEAAVLLRYETAMRPAERRWDDWSSRQRARIVSGLDSLERDWADEFELVTGGTIAAAVVIGYLDFRMPDLAWRAGRPALAAFIERFNERESMKLTQPVDVT